MNPIEVEALPDRLKKAREAHAQILNAMPANERAIALAEFEALTQASGKNETERRASKETILQQNEAYQTALKQRIQLKEDAAQAEIEVLYQKDRKDCVAIIAKMTQED